MPLPCGCRLCGCLCPEHSPFRADTPCLKHGGAVALAVCWEAMCLVAAGLFAAMIIAWAAILSGLPPCPQC